MGPDSSVCGWGAAANALQHGHTVEILNEAQAAFDALQFPGIDVILGQFVDDDDEQFTSNYFSQFVTNPYVYEMIYQVQMMMMKQLTLQVKHLQMMMMIQHTQQVKHHTQQQMMMTFIFLILHTQATPPYLKVVVGHLF